MPNNLRPNEINVFLCRTSVDGKLRAKFLNIIPAVGSHILIGANMFVVKAVVHPLNLYDDIYCGDRPVEIFVEPKVGDRMSDVENYNEVSITELAKINSLFS